MAAETPRDLFDDEPAPTSPSVVLSQVLAGKKPASKPQQAFHRLVQKIEAKRAELALWQAYSDRYQQRVAAEVLPLQRELAAEQRQMALFLDQVLGGVLPGRALGRVQRLKVVDLLMNLLTGLLAQGEDAELEAIHDRHADLSHAQSKQDELALTEALLADVFGVEIDADHGAATTEELLAHGQRKLQERAEAEALRAQAQQAAREGKRSSAARAKAEAAQALRDQATKEVSQSLREVYRKLASALHPDRESDAQERQRKTALMQRVNQAYEANDLLSLLGLQLEIEQIDAQHLADVPPQRLAHYSQILREQLQELEAELAQCVAPFRAALGWGWRASATPEKINQSLSSDIAELRLALLQLRQDRALWADPKALRQFLATYEPEPDLGHGFVDPFDLIDDLVGGAAPRKRRRS